MAGFSAVPLGIGLVAVVTIFLMTIPVDLDTISTVTLAACHLTLVPISVVAIAGCAEYAPDHGQWSPAAMVRHLAPLSRGLPEGSLLSRPAR